MRAPAFVLAVLQFWWLSATFSGASACQHEWVEIGSTCYSVRTDRLDWSSASTSCQLMGAKLAEPKIEKDNNLIKDYLKAYADCESYYFGLSSSDGRTFRFQDDVLTYSHGWGSGQPKQLNVPMIYAKYQCSQYTWGVNDGTSKLPYICELLEPTTTTSITTQTPTATATVEATWANTVNATSLLKPSNNGTFQNTSTISQSVINWNSGARTLNVKAMSLTTLSTLFCFALCLHL
ncbi:uncharacterized protein [Haliotis cracherodii]|uniref:uncharacterized protein n=1 Tax=Haliotis cracherodii TaxID=6455 RepID=UPI0039EA07E5